MDRRLHVCLIAEGSYPYVAGGVGNWTHDLIASLPEIDFTVAALWPSPETAGRSKYVPPRNLREVRTVYLHHGAEMPKDLPADMYARLEKFHGSLRHGGTAGFADVCPHVSSSRFLRDRGAWDLVGRLYEACAPRDTPFADYFWTWRSTHGPIFHVLESRLPECDVIHTISTGYAGLLGAAERIRTGTPLVTTEHGLYTRERWCEIQDAEWIPGEAQALSRRSSNPFKDWWNRMFLGLERLTYAHSDRIVALFEENRRYQVEHGAPRERTLVVPNGVVPESFDAIRRRRRDSPAFRAGLVGRVVPIKDVKTFISACKMAAARLNGTPLEAYVMGPAEEDETYARQCREMVELLGLQRVVTFTGRVPVEKAYESIDALVLTSLSEGQPLALLEANACGLPAIATDVGSCRELLEGATPEDRRLGPSGIVTPIGDPETTARAMVELAVDEPRRRTMGATGRSRVDRFYRWDRVRGAYLDLYRSVVDGRR